ncbi:RNA polymerase sigma factor [Polluticoccus soli]|uniref:RNA polymerase sigma factor n=1 Tax=Polluticoccus soli TaxID=3034150 RepID=UPI0023E211BF|nr:sigma-70 family RNA polymerase sigma factor [Flavipsychrobacter sp. JY13-12]
MTADYKKLSDEELVFRYAHRNEPAAVNCLFDRYGHLVFGVCAKYLRNTEAAKDATQQVFIKLLEDLRRFEIQHFKSWLYQVSKNHCLMQLRKPIPVVNNEIASTENVESYSELHHKIEEERLYDKLDAAIAELNTEQKTCVDMFYLQKMTYAEISAKTGYSIMQVKSAIQNGRRNLKIKMEAIREVKS